MSNSRKIISNIFSLSFAELLSKGIIFFANAILARTILPDGFGIIGMANSILVYLLLITNLGFNTLGSREISLNKSLIGKYVNNINTLRLMLSAVVFLVYLGMILLSDISAEVKSVYMIAALGLFSNAILVDWVFLGTERMGVLAVRQVLTSVLNFAGIYLLVRSRSDTVLAMSIFTGTTFINSVWLILLYIKEYGKFRFELDKAFIKQMLKSSFHIAYYIFFVTVLNTINIIIINIIAPTEQLGNYQAGIFSAASKVFVFSILPSAIVQQAFFPLLSRSQSDEERHKVLDKYSMLLFLIGPVITLTIFAFSPFVNNVIFGEKYLESASVMRFLMLASYFIYINTSLSVPLIAWKYEKYSTYSIIVGIIVNIAGNFLLIPIFGVDGSGMATMLAEISISIMLTIYIYKKLKRIYLSNLFKMTVYSVISCGLGYYLWYECANAIISGSITILTFILINVLFKTVTINEIKGYLRK